ncbi:4-amino-4-deoxy-L-arabinose transferase [Lishizhenia tianjinensis]|uniref:4-amino-4-deoxy-L-arabinose transferase n=1 Tax=Lishizhenia tianjinensis TaxID=477690 RepID=A0A1I7BC39_9FLAO|nr:glycosyltransferase family 39 protein [Lishizhenia tianjinensis]SFT84763.1 4-amino-4-deoxy-L-arabinose transferase [Lishizhenia tianjinensis]
MRTNITQRTLFVVLLLLLFIPLFQHLGSLPIQTWDEARLAVNAYEMLHNHDFIVTYHEGEPDMWNTKPPLLIWLHVLSASIFGISEFSLRLPSALAALFTCVLLFQFTRKFFDNFWMGFITALVLVTSAGYVSLHGTRTLDYDALLTLFSTLALISIFKYTQEKQNKDLYLFFLALTLGVLTKSVVILIFTPAIILFLLLQKQLLELLKNKHLYFGILGFLTLVLGYYGLRELYNPGYINAVFENELGGRYLAVIEEHKKGFWFYYENLIRGRFKAWYLLIPIGCITGFINKDKKIVALTLFLTLSVLVFFGVISNSNTKLMWYDLPLYPLLAILASYPLFLAFQFLKSSKLTDNHLRYNILPYIFLFFIFITPYRSIIAFTYKPELEEYNFQYHALSFRLQNGLKHPETIDNTSIVYKGYNTQLIYYVNLLRDKDIAVNFKSLDNLSPGDTVILTQEEVDTMLPKLYNYQLLNDKDYVKTYIIHDRK